MNARVARLPGAIAALNPLRPLWAVGRWLGRVVEPAPPTLGGYAPQKAPTRHALVKRSIYALIIFVGIFYGLMVAVFPMFLYLYMAIPIIFLALLIIWALPESDTIPESKIEWLFWAFFLGLFLWPNYLAITLPGLPWITLLRLITGPLVILLLASVSISKPFRGKIAAILNDSPWISRPFLVFLAIETITLGFSKHLANAFNRYLANQLEWTVIFFIACFVFMKEGRAVKWARLLCFMAAALAVMSIFEKRNGAVLWAGHVPWFLAVADESVQRTLSGASRAATGIYRLQTIFSTPLNFAEMMGLSTAFFIHMIVKAQKSWLRYLVIAYIPLHFWAIQGTDSRLGMIAFFGSFLLYLFVWSFQRWRDQVNDLVSTSILFAYPAIIGTFIVLSFVWQKLERMIWGGGAQQASNDSRKTQWRMLWPKLEQWPFGHGVTSSGEVLGFANGAGVVTVDSYYITVLINYGILGFLAYYGMILAGAVGAFKLGIRARNDDESVLLPASVVLCLFIVIKGVLSQEDSHAMIFMLLGMVVALTHRANQLNIDKIVGRTDRQTLMDI